MPAERGWAVNLAESLRQCAQRNGFDLDEVLGGSGTARRASNDGGVSVPSDYVYDPDQGSLHDYCTHSPDQFPSPGDNADFSGACARHDMCYEANDGNDDTMAQRNSELRENLLTVCPQRLHRNVRSPPQRVHHYRERIFRGGSDCSP